MFLHTYIRVSNAYQIPGAHCLLWLATYLCNGINISLWACYLILNSKYGLLSLGSGNINTSVIPSIRIAPIYNNSTKNFIAANTNDTTSASPLASNSSVAAMNVSATSNKHKNISSMAGAKLKDDVAGASAQSKTCETAEGTPSRLCKSTFNTTAPMYGVSLTSGKPVTVVQIFPDLLQQVIYETCE